MTGFTAPIVCPPWCTADHAAQLHAVDRLHHSDAVEVAAVEEMEREFDDELEQVAVASTVELVLEMPISAAQPTVLLLSEVGGWSIRLTPESVERLIPGLERVLRIAETTRARQ